MTMWRRLVARLTGRGAPPSDAEIARELQDHLDLEAEMLSASDPRVVRANDTARRRFGNVATTGEAIHDVWRLPWAEQLVQDVRHGCRALVRSPAYSVAVVITLSLGIGAAAASFCFSDAIRRPFPFFPEDQLLSIVQRGPHCSDCNQSSPAAFLALRDRARSMTTIATSTWRTTARFGDESRIVEGYRLSPNVFEVISAPFALGRGFAPDADRPGAPRTTVLSYDFWRDQLHGNRAVLDSTITLGGNPYTVVGVLARDVVFPTDADVYAPLGFATGDAHDYASHYLDLFARLSVGATVASAGVEGRTIGAQLALESPATDEGLGLVVRPIARYHTEDVVVIERIATLASLLVFLAACMSAANLTLSRNASRRNELALRIALGVGRWRLTRHLLTEGALLSLVAGTLGVWLAHLAVGAMRSAMPTSMSRFVPGWLLAGVDVRTVVFTSLAAIAATLAFAALPAIRSTRSNLAEVLSDGGRSSTGGIQGTRTRSTLVVVEVSIALILLTAATLLTRSVRNMIAGDPGVRRDGVLTMHLSLPATMTDSAMRDFYRRLDANLRSTDGVSSSGITSTTPLSNNWWGTGFDVPGRIPPKKGETLAASDQRITPDYLRTAGMRIVAGRAITSGDVLGAGRVVVVNQMLATAIWPGVNPLGRTLTIDSAAWTVVGVAANIHHGGLDEPVHFTLYRSIDQAVQRAGDLAVATQGDPAAMRDAVRQAVSRTDPSAAVGEIMTMREMEARHVSPFRMSAGMLAVLATVTMVIATVGLYGLIAYGVAQRTREIGVRIAVGARARDVLSYVGLGAVRLTVVGLAFGLVGAVAFARLLGAMLYGVTASDPITFIGAAIGLLVVGLAAALVPAWRAAQIDPTVALRK
jgi:predicted permease